MMSALAPWTRRVAPDHAQEPLRAAYDAILRRAPHRGVLNLWQASGLDPEGLMHVHGVFRALTDDPGPLTVELTELVAVVVSATNGCAYWVAHHGPRLTAALGDEELARAVARDYRTANLAARNRVALDYAIALTCEPSERTRADIERVREYGFADSAIVRLTELTACFNMVNRIASGLGIELEPGIEPWEFGAQK